MTYPTLSLSLQVTHCWLSRHFTIHHSVIFFASHNARLRPRPLRIGLASPHSSSQIRSVGNSARQCPTTLSPLLALELSRCVCLVPASYQFTTSKFSGCPQGRALPYCCPLTHLRPSASPMPKPDEACESVSYPIVPTPLPSRTRGFLCLPTSLLFGILALFSPQPARLLTTHREAQCYLEKTLELVKLNLALLTSGFRLLVPNDTTRVSTLPAARPLSRDVS